MTEREYVVFPPFERPRKRRAAVRVIVVAAGAGGDQALLLRDSDPGCPEFSWWVTPGGGMDPGETERQTAVRELAEETGLAATPQELVGPVARRLVVHGFSDELLEQTEAFYLLRTERYELDTSGHTEDEKLTLTGHRWWPVAELENTAEWVWPKELLAMIDVATTSDEPLDLGLVLDESTVPAADFDAIVLAGGQGKRLGGASKPDLLDRGTRLLDSALAAAAPARGIVVVAPDSVAVPDGVRRTLEDPPFGGPVAGLAAGLTELSRERTSAGIVAVLACDMPHLQEAVPRLVSALEAASGEVDGVCLRDETGRRQWVAAAYRTAALAAVLDKPRDASMHRTLSSLNLLIEPARGGEARDIDVLSDLIE